MKPDSLKPACPLLLMLAVGCGSDSQPNEAVLHSADMTARMIGTPAPGEPIDSEAEAIAVVLAEIERSGGDSQSVECHAVLARDRWIVDAWLIVGSKNNGSRRFMPCGFTTYVVSKKDGSILETPDEE